MTTSQATVHDYLQLLRIPNVFTAVADASMGFWLAGGTADHPAAWLIVSLASVALYLAGMVWNDLLDLEHDRVARPERPLPAGRIPRDRARRLGIGMLAGGLVAGIAAPWCGPTFPAPPAAARSLVVAGLLVANILAYNGRWKRTAIGPLLMGGCRWWNVLLGASAAGQLAPAPWPFAPATLLAAAGIGVYVVGITWLARRESQSGFRPTRAAACLVLVTGIALLAPLHLWIPYRPTSVIRNATTWWGLLVLVSITIARRCVLALLDPRPELIQRAVQHAIWSLIVLDASIMLLVAPPVWSLAVLALLAPTLILGSRFSGT